MNYFSPHPRNYAPDSATCQSIADRDHVAITLHAHNEWTGSVPNAKREACNEDCIVFRPKEAA